MEPSPRIHIFGASGFGTTTLGFAVAKHLGILHLDTDEYYWKKTDPPFTEKNTPERRIERIKLAIEDSSGWVLSGSICSWGDPLLSKFNLALFLTLDPATRMKRLKKRQADRYRTKIMSSDDMYDQHIEFMSWVRSYDYAKAPVRSLGLHSSWMENLHCPILKLDSTKPAQVLAHEVIQTAA